MAAICLSAVLAVVLAGCDAESTPSTPSSISASSECGTLPSRPPQDPDQTLATISQRAAYNGWPYPVRRSTLADWKPKGTGPYTVGVIYDGTANPFQAASFQAIQDLLRRSPAVGNVIADATESGNPTRQIQAYQSMVNRGVDLIVLEPSSAPAFVARTRAALDRGIATLVLISVLDDPSVVNYAPNVYTSAGAALAQFLKLQGGRGRLLGVHGIRATEVDRSTWVSFRDVLAQCPDVELVGEISTDFTPPGVRAAVLQYLATHPGKIDGVFHTAIMGSSIIGAFQQAGRPVPPVTAMAAQKGELAYWAAHAGEGYDSAGFAGGPVAFADGATRIALRMLAGQGPRTNMIPWPQPQITAANLSQYVQPQWTLDTPGTVEQPAATYWADNDLDSLFTHPDRRTDGSPAPVR
ncbi:MAG TPA: substrate-binding domain-containing protein [Actinoplanes sp.]|nr:substrate-binding domain-containing protein [Actinoplanes sp.]